jgi:hypothetical protein
MIMNAILKNLSQIGQFVHVGRIKKVTQIASGSIRQQDDLPGSYGRGFYAGHSTYALDFRSQGSYGRGSYTGHSTADLDFGTQGRFAVGA